jgi:protein MBA1
MFSPPGTFILPPFSELPKGFGNKLRFLWQWLLIKVQEIAMNSSTKYASKPSFFRRAQLRVSRRTLIPTAKALHRTMAQALASGDKDTLYRICSQKLSQSLCGSIDTRPRGRSYGWELVKYTNPLFYPSIRSHRLSPLGMSKEDPIVRQVVVAISSRQRRVAYDSKGQVVPGSEKEIDVVENVAMGCIIDPKTWQQSEWRLIGTVKSTTPGEWQREKKLMTRLMKDS